MCKRSDNGKIPCFQNPGHGNPSFVETPIVTHAAERANDGNLED